MSAFWVLCFMWLKFAVIWRFFRWASLHSAPLQNHIVDESHQGIYIVCFPLATGNLVHMWSATCRLAALLDGVDPPENMRRCFANNYDLEVGP